MYEPITLFTFAQDLSESSVQCIILSNKDKLPNYALKQVLVNKSCNINWCKQLLEVMGFGKRLYVQE